MLSQQAKQAVYLRAALDAVLLTLAFALAFLIRSYLPLPLVTSHSPLNFAVHFWLPVVAVPLYWALSSRTAPDHRSSSFPDTLRSVAVPFTYLGFVLGTAIFLFQAKSFSRAVFFIFLLLGFLFIVSERIIQRFSTSRFGGRWQSFRNLLIVGLREEALAVRRTIESHPEYQMRIVGHVAAADEEIDAGATTDVLGTVDDLKRIVEEQVVDDVIFVVSPAAILGCERHIAWCEEIGVTVHLKVDFVRTLFARTYPTELDGTPMLTFSSTPRDAVALLAKRALDIGVSLIALIFLSPVILLSALAIRLTSGRPIIFSQKRVGLNGRPFELYKLRSMYADAEGRKAELATLNEASGPVFKIKNDPRVTPVGRLLRKFSIDELPQLWNVLIGDMSLVGPRPPLDDEVRQYQRWQKRRLSMKPGITCLWQVNGRNLIPFEDWMKLDLEYIDNWSLGLDFKILLRTIPAVVLAKGVR